MVVSLPVEHDLEQDINFFRAMYHKNTRRNINEGNYAYWNPCVSRIINEIVVLIFMCPSAGTEKMLKTWILLGWRGNNTSCPVARIETTQVRCFVVGNVALCHETNVTLQWSGRSPVIIYQCRRWNCEMNMAISQAHTSLNIGLPLRELNIETIACYFSMGC